VRRLRTYWYLFLSFSRSLSLSPCVFIAINMLSQRKLLRYYMDFCWIVLLSFSFFDFTANYYINLIYIILGNFLHLNSWLISLNKYLVILHTHACTHKVFLKIWKLIKMHFSLISISFLNKNSNRNVLNLEIGSWIRK